jgi:hypothetical protein
MAKRPRRPGEGRPSKLTAETQALIVNALQTGAHLSEAAAHAEVSEDSVYRWMALGKERPHTREGQFRQAIRLAMKKAALRYVTIIASGATKEDAKWMLTHRYPRGWADRSRQQQDVALSAKVQVDPGDGRARLAALLERIARSKGEDGGESGSGAKEG